MGADFHRWMKAKGERSKFHKRVQKAKAWKVFAARREELREAGLVRFALYERLESEFTDEKLYEFAMSGGG